MNENAVDQTYCCHSLAHLVVLRRPGHTEHGPWHAESLVRVPVAYAIGSIAAFWTVQRVVGFWG